MTDTTAPGKGCDYDDEPLGEWRPLAGADGWSFRPQTAFDMQDHFFAPDKLAARADPSGLAWMAADVATSIRLSEGRYLWLFGDTFVGRAPLDKAQWTGKADIAAFPRQTLALVDLSKGHDGRPVPSGLRFIWRTPGSPPATNSTRSSNSSSSSRSSSSSTNSATPQPPPPEADKAAAPVRNMFEPPASFLAAYAARSLASAREAPTATATSTSSSTPAPTPAPTEFPAGPEQLPAAQAGDGAPSGEPSAPSPTSTSTPTSTPTSPEPAPAAIPGVAAPTEADASHILPWYWVVSGVRPREDGPLLLLGSVVEIKPNDVLGFAISCTGAIVVQNPDDDPQDWSYQQVVVPGSRPDFSWFSGTAVMGEHVYLVGLHGQGLDTRQVLGRLPVDRALALDFDAMEVWSAPVDAPEKPAWTPLHSFLKEETRGAKRRRRLVSLFGDRTLGVTELSLAFDPRLQRWVMATMLAFESRVGLWTAPSPTGPWVRSDALTEAEFADFEKAVRARLGGKDVKSRIYYSAKLHPELSHGGDLVLTYCANIIGDWPAAVDYTPRFFRLELKKD